MTCITTHAFVTRKENGELDKVLGTPRVNMQIRRQGYAEVQDYYTKEDLVLVREDGALKILNESTNRKMGI